MKKVTITKFNHKTIVSETEIEKPIKKRFFGRKRAFVDPVFGKCMTYKRFDTYEENKQDYYNTLQLVFSGKCKDINEAYELNH